MEDENIYFSMKSKSNILNISSAVIGFLFLVVFGVIIIQGLITETKSTIFNFVIPNLIFVCLILSLTSLKFKLWKKCNIPLEENKNLKYCTNLIGLCLFFSILMAIEIPFIDYSNGVEIEFKSSISLFILFLFSGITYLSIVKMWKNALLYVRSFVFLIVLCLIGWFIWRIKGNLNTPITSFDLTNPILIFILFCLLFAFVFKGIMISFTPSFRRYFRNQRIDYSDVLIVTVLSFGFIVSIIF